MWRLFTSSLLPAVLGICCLAVAVVVPRKFESIGWPWLIGSLFIVLGVVAVIYFAFVFTPPNFATGALRVSRFPRAAAGAMTAGSGYMAAWLANGLSDSGWGTKLTCLPGLILLAVAWFIFWRFRDRSFGA